MLKDRGRRGAESGSRNRVGSLLIVSEIALSFVLLAGAGLLIKSFINLREINPGFNADNVLVTQRTHEIGVRMALGAQIVDVLKLVLRRTMLLAVAGIGIGVIGAAVVTRYVTTLLFGVKPIDTMTFVALVLAAVVFVACLVPARRAAKIDPLEALR